MHGFNNYGNLFHHARHNIVLFLYYQEGATFFDGTLEEKVFIKQLENVFGATYFIMSQVNPYINPFLPKHSANLVTPNTKKLHYSHSISRKLDKYANFLKFSHQSNVSFLRTRCIFKLFWKLR